MSIRDDLFSLKDEKYKLFHSGLTKTKHEIIGVRLPLLKEYSKSLDCDFEYFNNLNNPYFEEVMLEGLLIGRLQDIELVKERLDIFISKIDDWSVNDSLVSSLRITKRYKEIIWDYIIKYKDSVNEYEVRFMVVMMMAYYLDNEYINDVLEIIDNINLDFYYVKMGIAWLLATCIVKFEKETLSYLKKCSLDKWTFNKMISKCNDSYRVRDELKILLKEMRK